MSITSIVSLRFLSEWLLLLSLSLSLYLSLSLSLSLSLCSIVWGFWGASYMYNVVGFLFLFVLFAGFVWLCFFLSFFFRSSFLFCVCVCCCCSYFFSA